MKVINFYQSKIILNNVSINKKNEKNIIYFSKYELKIILNFYSKQVSNGLWRDYAIDNLKNESLFSIYKHTFDQPLYQIIKISKKDYGKKPYFIIRNYRKILDKSDFIDLLLTRFEKSLSLKN